jgi:hypothetical protein
MLDQVARGAQSKGMQGMLHVLHGRDDDGLGLWAPGQHVVDELKARAIAQVEVHQQDIEFVLVDERH